MFQIIIQIALLIGLAIVIYLLLTKKDKETDNGNSEKLVTLMEKVSNLAEHNKELRQVMDAKLAETHKASQDQFGKTAGMMQNINKQTQEAMSVVHKQSQEVIAKVTEKLTKLDETNKQVVNFSSQLKNLQDILKNPKQRGVLGEYATNTSFPPYI